MVEQGASKSAGPRALIADDQADVLTALQLLLKGEGYQTEAVTSPAGVLEAVTNRGFDLLLMDLNYARDTTSGQEGLDLLAEIQEIDDTLPIVVMTGWGSIELAVEAMRRGVRDFVQKPWDNSKLISILQKQIQHGMTLRKKRRLESENRLFAESLQEIKDLQGLQNQSLEHFRNSLQCRSVIFFSKAAADRTFSATAQIGIPDGSLTRHKIKAESSLIERLGRSESPIDIRRLSLTRDEEAFINLAEAIFAAPVHHQEELIAFLSVGPKNAGDDYDPNELNFMTDAGARIAVGIDNLRLRGQDREMEEARQIQKNLMPKEIPQIKGYEIADAWRPASVVSGDYFDVLKFDESRIALCIADVAGKGLPAALLMSNVQASVKAYAASHVMPDELCLKLNQVVCSNTADDKFITFFYGLLDARARVLRYSNAGHNPPILVRLDGSAVRLAEGGPVLGVFSDWTSQSSKVSLESGDRILLFTDGVTEVQNPSGEEFGERRLTDLLTRNRSLGAAQLQERIMDAVSEFSNGNFLDDATIIVMAVE